MVVTNLPYQITSFIGREDDLSAIERLISTSRLVTLTGVGGCGKTRLAIEVANSVREMYTDGVWLIDLAPIREPVLVPQLVAQTLGLPLAADEPWLETIYRFVEPKKLLLVLDNCEHLGEACARLARELLSKAPEVRIMATSRAVLGIYGEVIYPLSGLAWPTGNQEVAGKGMNPINSQELMRYDAIHLFVDRARACVPNFRLTAENAHATVEICRRLDGLPLALELASAQVSVLTVQEIAYHLGGHLVDHLNEHFDFLTASQRSGSDPRHQTLRAAIDWSYALLSVDEQVLLRHLAVFEAGFTLDTAEAVCSFAHTASKPIIEGIASLVSKSLVVADTIGRAQARYRLLETIREYALDKLQEAGETADLRDRHLDHFLARAEEAEPKLNEAYQQLWLNWLENEHDNYRAALAWASESRSTEKGLRIASAIVRFWEIRGYVQEGLSWLERLLHQADEAVSPIVRANAFSRAAFLAMFLDDAATTTAYGREAVAAAESAGDEGKVVLIIALGAFCSGARVSRDFQTAYEIGERMIRLLKEASGQPFLLCMTLITMGGIAMEMGHDGTAHAYLDEGLTLAQADGDPFRTAHALNILGDLARCEQKYAEALAYYERSVALLRELNAQRDLASVLRNLGHTCLHLGNIERAQTLFCESMAIQQTLRNMPGVAECLMGFAAIAILQNMPAAGVRLLGASGAAARKRVTVATAWRATRMEYECYFDLARAGLSPSDFLEEQAIGQAMSMDQAIHYALDLPGKAQPTPAIKKVVDMLTSREREVAGLIGQGKSNGEIAQELVLSKRTVETHITNILSKLGLSHRAQIMRWAIDQGLPPRLA